MENITEKIRNNAIITYLLIGINISFLLNKHKTNINNDFVKNHTKTAILIHSLLLINTVIFAYIGLGINISFFGYSISDIITITIYLILFGLLLMGINKAYSLQTFKLGEKLNYNYKNSGNDKILEITSNGRFSEKDKLTITLSKIPFIGFIIYPKYINNKIIESSVKINLIFSLIFISLHTFGNNNLATLLLLIYIIFTVFSTIYLFTQNEIININLNKIPNPSLLLNYIKTNITYILNYISNKKDFPDFSEILKTKINIEKEKDEILKKDLELKPNFKLKKCIIYIPFINFITLFNLETKQKIHIINGLIISILSIIILILNYFYFININYLLFLLFPIFFGLGYLRAGIINYKLPLLFGIYNIYILFYKKIKYIFKKIKKIKNTETEINLKVSNNDITTKIKNDSEIENSVKTQMDNENKIDLAVKKNAANKIKTNIENGENKKIREVEKFKLYTK